MQILLMPPKIAIRSIEVSVDKWLHCEGFLFIVVMLVVYALVSRWPSVDITTISDNGELNANFTMEKISSRHMHQL